MFLFGIQLFNTTEFNANLQLFIIFNSNKYNNKYTSLYLIDLEFCNLEELELIAGLGNFPKFTP